MMPAGMLQEDHGRGISDASFLRLGRLITSQCGIRMPPQKKGMLENRLRKRLHLLGLDSFEAYGQYLFSPAGMSSELVHLIDAVTTNKTDFFREPAHYELLREKVLPELVQQQGAGQRTPLRVWSAGCSTGEEPYTLAMVLAEFAESLPALDFQIFGSDISTRVLETARLGIYPADRGEPLPLSLRRKYLLRSRDGQQVRIAPELRSRVSFRRINFMEEDYGLTEKLDVVFCRNVLIYFDRIRQETILRRLCRHLPPKRYLFTGHSETLNGMDLPLTAVAPSVYRRT